MEREPDGPYIYQPFGSVTHPEHNAAGRLWAIAGLHRLATVQGLTKQEAARVLAALTSESASEGKSHEHAN